MSRTFWRYGLWTATLLTVWWVAAIASALIGSKGSAATAVPTDTNEEA